MSGLRFRGLILACLVVHFTRIFVIPFFARVTGNDEYTDTQQVLHGLGYKPTGPCSLPRPKKPCSVRERIHVVLVSAQWDREPFTQDETEVMIKSMLSSTECRIHFHFMVAGEREEWGLSEMMEALNAVPFDSVGPVSPNLVKHDAHARAEEISTFPDVEDDVEVDPPVGYTIHPIPVRWIQEQVAP